MAQYNTKQIRNIALAGHGGSGKTSLAEALLYCTGGLSRLGKVDDGNTVCDFDAEEIKRKMSVRLSLATFEFSNHKINLIDAPGYYDFVNGLYVGAGVGIAVPKTELQGAFFNGGDNSKRSVSPMLGVMLGYTYELDYNLTLDIRYRLAGLMGNEIERTFKYKVDNNTYNISSDTGLILDNSLSIGIRYNF